METLKILLIVLAFFLIGILLFYLSLYIAEKGMKKKVAVSHICMGFRQKMWMTTGLGIFFFGLYLLVAMLASFYKDPSLRLNLFFYIYENPTLFIYLGLTVFAFISISIYLVRMVIKHLYNTNRKF